MSEKKSFPSVSKTNQYALFRRNQYPEQMEEEQNACDDQKDNPFSPPCTPSDWVCIFIANNGKILLPKYVHEC